MMAIRHSVVSTSTGQNVQPPPPNPDEVFILRFWREVGRAPDESHWRAQVTHVNTRKRQMADSIEAALAVIRFRLDALVISTSNEK
jgi:hypothetical protein